MVNLTGDEAQQFLNRQVRSILCSRLQASDFSPIFKSLAEFLAISGGSQLMLLGVKVVSNWSKGREKSLRLPGELKCRSRRSRTLVDCWKLGSQVQWNGKPG